MTINQQKSQRKSTFRSQDSKVGKKISEVATKTVIITCFVLLVALPLFNSEFYLSDKMSPDAACQQLKSVLDEPSFKGITSRRPVFDLNYQSDIYSANEPEKYLNSFIRKMEEVYKENGDDLMQVNLNDSYVYYINELMTKRRQEELLKGFCYCDNISSDITIAVDNQASVQLNAILNIIRTFFVSLIVIGGSYLFGFSINNLMIMPIERMIERVTLLILKPQKIKEEAFIKQEEEESRLVRIDTQEDEIYVEELETVKIEQAINKIGILLGVGFGDAGTSLINSYLSKDGEGDIMIPGQEIDAIFGFCDIRNFTDITEILEQEVMVFVNTIAEIVHTLTDKYLGAANKNIGDAFLLVWKPKDSLMLQMKNTRTNQLNLMTCLADLALIAFLKIYYHTN